MGDETDSASPTAAPSKVQIIHHLRKWQQRRHAKRLAESTADRAARLTAAATLWMAFFTAVLSVVSYLQFHELISAGAQTDKLIDQTTRFADAAKVSAAASKAAAEAAATNNALEKAAEVANFRAWVGPNQSSLDAPIVKGKADGVTINYQNTGREPAQGFLYGMDLWTGTGVDQKSLSRQDRDVQDCMSKAPTIGTEVVYPTTGFSSYTITGKVPASSITDAVISGRDIIIIQGCFIYITANQTHHSAFCVFYRSGFSNPKQLNICNRGNYAD